MRKILFRGYSEEYGWIYGDYAAPNGIHPVNIFPHKDSNAIEGVAVEPKTVGQYTGLTDRNGKKIFEGDIVKGISYSSEWRGVIIWIDEIASFGLYCGHEVAWENSSILKRTAKGTNDEFTAEVIGNIHDNPELMEGVKYEL